MKMMKNPKVRLLVLPSLALMGLVSCGGQKEHVHEFEAHEEVFPTCCEEGTEAYQTCKGCEKFFDMAGEEIEAPVKTPIDRGPCFGLPEPPNLAFFPNRGPLQRGLHRGLWL